MVLLCGFLAGLMFQYSPSNHYSISETSGSVEVCVVVANGTIASDVAVNIAIATEDDTAVGEK